jgi:hypothetical protein
VRRHKAGPCFDVFGLAGIANELEGRFGSARVQEVFQAQLLPSPDNIRPEDVEPFLSDRLQKRIPRRARSRLPLIASDASARGASEATNREEREFRYAHTIAPARARYERGRRAMPWMPLGRAVWRSAFLLLERETDEEHPDREHRAEHTKDDARCHQIGTSESVHEQPKPPGEDQPGTESPRKNRARRSRETPRREWVARMVASADRLM